MSSEAKSDKRGRKPMSTGRKVLIGFGSLGVVLVVAWLIVRTLWPPINDVTTGQTPEYPDLVPQVFARSPEAVFPMVVDVVDGIERMRVIEKDPEAMQIEAEADTPRGTFTDDVTLRVEHAGDGGARVHIRSRSRVGKADFGQNARNIREIQGALSDEIGSSAPQ